MPPAITANAQSGVVEGWAIEQDATKPSRGAGYILANRKRFILSAEECRMVGSPRWDFGDD